MEIQRFITRLRSLTFYSKIHFSATARKAVIQRFQYSRIQEFRFGVVQDSVKQEITRYFGNRLLRLSLNAPLSPENPE